MVNQVSQAAADGANLGMTIYQNVNGIGMAETKYSMDLASAEAIRLQTTSDILESYRNKIQSTMKNVTESINQSKELLAYAQKNADASASNSTSVI